MATVCQPLERLRLSSNDIGGKPPWTEFNFESGACRDDESRCLVIEGYDFTVSRLMKFYIDGQEEFNQTNRSCRRLDKRSSLLVNTRRESRNWENCKILYSSPDQDAT